MKGLKHIVYIPFIIVTGVHSKLCYFHMGYILSVISSLFVQTLCGACEKLEVAESFGY